MSAPNADQWTDAGLARVFEAVKKEPKHTPGPWMVSSYGNIKRDYTEIGCTDGELIAAVHGHPNSGFFPSEAERVANARLIAAAPDLLGQLQAAANYIDALGGDSKKYRAAIAKALGEQQ